MARIAIIGTGAAGLAAGWALGRRHDVEVFEAAERCGGHANTVEVDHDGGARAVDTGFLVYNARNYPHLVRLFAALGVETRPSDMSFAVSLDEGRIEYTGSPGGLFARRRNLLRPRFWAMARDLLRFYREAAGWRRDGSDLDRPLGALLAERGYGPAFLDDHLLPMAAAIWSCPKARVLDFPAHSFLAFMDNHGLLGLADRPAWRTVAGGSRDYVDRIAAGFGQRLHLATPVRRLVRRPEGVLVQSDRGEGHFDQVVVATHADQALALLGEDADGEERTLLGAFGYARNDAILHGDPTLMPRRRRAWASWNYLGRQGAGRDRDVAVTYWLNRLQGFGGGDLFVSLNPLAPPDPTTVQGRFQYDHPILDGAAVAAQTRLGAIQGRRRTWFCGSYCGHGFHEDAVEAGFGVAEALDAPVPWAGEVVGASPAAETVRPWPPVGVQRSAVA